MSFLDLIIGQNDRTLGLDLLRTYHSEAKKYAGFKQPDFLLWISSIEAYDKGFVDSLGALVKSNYRSTTVEQAKSRLRSLAMQSKGMARNSDLIMAAGGKGDTVVWSAMIPEVVRETVVDVGSGLKSVGSEAFWLGRNYKKIAFAAAVLAALYFASQFKPARKLVFGNPGKRR